MSINSKFFKSLSCLLPYPQHFEHDVYLTLATTCWPAQST
jgi:hypothetical protein